MKSTHDRARVRGLAAVATAVALAAGVAGCGSSSSTSSSSTSTSTSSAGSAISASELTQLKAVVKAAQAPPKWTSPGPSVNAKSALTGKTIVTFPISSGIDACTTQQADFTKAASALGANVKALSVNNPGGPPAWISNLNAAKSQKASAVVIFCGATAAAIAPTLKELQSAHIPVVDGNYNETDGNPAFPFTDLAGETGVDTAGGVTDDLADALVNLNGKPAHILFLDSPSIAQYSGAKAALQAAITKYCPNTCSIDKEYDVQVQDWGNEQQQVSSDLQADHNINTVITTFDGMSDDIVNTVSAAASTHPGIKIYAWGGGLAEIKNVESNPIMAADSGPDERWDAYDALDQIIRLVGGKSAVPVANEPDPNVFFTKSNAASFLAGGGYSDQPFGNGAFITDFDKLWGVS